MFFSRPAGERYFTRDTGEQYDFNLGDLVNDSDWHDLPLKNVTAKKPSLVFIFFNIITPTASDNAWFKQKGSAGKDQEINIRPHEVNQNNTQIIAIAPDSDGIIQYNLMSGEWSAFSFTIYGGFK